MLARRSDIEKWGTILDMGWADPVRGRNTALYHTSGPVPEQWLDKPSAYFYYRKVPGIGPALKIVNDDKADRLHIKLARQR